MIMNSWKASALPACTPPLMMLKEGTGSTWRGHSRQAGRRGAAQGLEPSTCVGFGAGKRPPRHTLASAAQACSARRQAQGRGRTSLVLPARSAMWRYSGTPFSAAPACKVATQRAGRQCGWAGGTRTAHASSKAGPCSQRLRSRATPGARAPARRPGTRPGYRWRPAWTCCRCRPAQSSCGQSPPANSGFSLNQTE